MCSDEQNRLKRLSELEGYQTRRDGSQIIVIVTQKNKKGEPQCQEVVRRRLLRSLRKRSERPLLLLRRI